MRSMQERVEKCESTEYKRPAQIDVLHHLRPLQQLKDALAEARFDDAELIIRYIQNVNYPIDGDCTLLHIFSTGTSLQPLDAVDFLLRHGANPNAKALIHGGTPLHDAAFANKTAICKKLLDYQANRTLKNNLGLTPQALAEFWGMKEVLGILRKYTPVKLEMATVKVITAESYNYDKEKVYETDAYSDEYMKAIWRKICKGIWPSKQNLSRYYKVNR